MLLIYLLFVCHIHALPKHEYNMYNTDQDQDGFCLFYYETDPVFDYGAANPEIRDIPDRVEDYPFLLIPYCLRMSENISLIKQFNAHKTFGRTFTFTELQKKNISSEMLLSWSASINLVERYQIFLNNISDPLTSSAEETLFYNCTSEWFGPFCRFRFFGNHTYHSVIDIVRNTMKFKQQIPNVDYITCYVHLKCQRSISLCLDWREICDGKIDCIDGSDEFDCWRIEINECAPNEYRCRNGQCVPKIFFHDDPLNPDCLDQTDEVSLKYYLSFCSDDPSFRCQEVTCRPGTKVFPCGDGQCLGSMDMGCYNRRDHILLSDECFTATNCLVIYSLFFEKTCEPYWMYNVSYYENTCPLYFEYNFRSILFHHIRFIYSNKIEPKPMYGIPLPEYVCYDEKLCGKIYPIEIFHNNLTCRHLNRFLLNGKQEYLSLAELTRDIEEAFLKCPPIFNETHYCNHSTIYQCYNSTKCISKHRLADGYSDCPFNDDETYNQSCSLNDTNYRFRCLVNNIETCFAPLAIRDGLRNCDSDEDENIENTFSVYPKNIFFGLICNRREDLLHVPYGENIVTDESDCEYWSCNNTYTQCDGYWSCKNGADELHCSPSICPLFYHQCIFYNDTSKVSCLPINRAGDGIIDCIGGTDELYQKIRTGSSLYPFFANYFQCQNGKKSTLFYEICDENSGCPLSEQEEFCKNYFDNGMDMCNSFSAEKTPTQEFLCQFDKFATDRMLIPKVLLKNLPIYSIQTINDIKLLSKPNPMNTQLIETYASTIISENPEALWCYTGIAIQVRIDENKSDISCLCPPGYYGNKCEYQNERVSLTFQVSFGSNWTDLFLFVITLIDNERNIEFYDYIDYSPMTHCDMKFNIYLLYSNRPKNILKNYSIQIDSLNKQSFNYRSSWIYPIKYPFLPIYRLSVLLKVPIVDAKTDDRCNSSCIHGQCFSYVNDPNSRYCRCDSGWSGIQCNIKLNCHCAPDSFCLSNSICLCPMDRYGSRCYLNYSSCDPNPCYNDGQCISSDLRLRNSDVQMYKCICPFGYSGKHCKDQESQSRIEVSFDDKIEIPSALFVHFLTIITNSTLLRRVSLMKLIPVDKDILSFDITFEFNMGFVQIIEDYYLIILREKEIVSSNISTRIDPSYRCLPINELLNTTMANQYYLKRIKSYPILCRERHELICFYDDSLICLCDVNRDANCFEFNRNMTRNCSEYNYCQNEGQCFFNKFLCPTSLICVCAQCYFGSQCQYSTRGSTLSLDIILGSHIRQNTEINNQTIIVKWSIAFNVILIIFGLINSILIYLTFEMVNTRDVGCGLYLFVSSFTSLITIILMTTKFWLLLFTQMGSIDNRSFISNQCLSFDFLIRSFLCINDWLYSCVSFDRAFNVYKGIHFDKAKSKVMAKWIIPFVFILSICTHIHDPISRYLSDDEIVKRTWCLTQYSSSLQIFDWIVNIIHVSFPFLINFFSALLIIKNLTQTRSKIHTKQTYRQILIEQLREHKHLIISSLILLILNIPRLIISLLSGCMKSPRNPWLHLIGYFISFIPSVLTFIVFVLPSETYKEQLQKSINRFRRRTN